MTKKIVPKVWLDTLPRKKKCTRVVSRRARVKRMHPRARLAHQIWVPSLTPAIHPSIHPSIRPRWTCIGHHPEPHCAVAPKSPMDAGRSVEREADRFQCIKSRNSHIHSSLSEAPCVRAHPTSSHPATTYKFFSSGLYIPFLFVFLKSFS